MQSSAGHHAGHDERSLPWTFYSPPCCMLWKKKKREYSHEMQMREFKIHSLKPWDHWECTGEKTICSGPRASIPVVQQHPTAERVCSRLPEALKSHRSESCGCLRLLWPRMMASDAAREVVTNSCSVRCYCHGFSRIHPWNPPGFESGWSELDEDVVGDAVWDLKRIAWVCVYDHCEEVVWCFSDHNVWPAVVGGKYALAISLALYISLQRVSARGIEA